MRLISSGEEREARAVFSWEISNLESAVCFAFSSSANFQVQQQKAVAAPWLLRSIEGKPDLRTKFHLFKIASSFSGTVAIAGSSGRAREAAQKRQFFPLARPTLRSL